MADIFYTLAQLKSLFWTATMAALGYDPDDYNDPNNPSATMPVRISWPTDGAPAWKTTEDVCFLRTETQDNPIDKQIDTTYIQKDSDNATEVVSQTRVLKVSWIFYGPNSFDNSFKFRTTIKLPTFHDALAADGIYLLVNDVSIPTILHEIYQGQWWERADLQALFNSENKFESTVPYIKTVPIEIIKEDGEVIDVNVT